MGLLTLTCIKPDRAIYFYIQGINAVRDSWGDRAIGYFTEAIKLKPDFFEAYGNRGIAYSLVGKIDLAIQGRN